MRRLLPYILPFLLVPAGCNQPSDDHSSVQWVRQRVPPRPTQWIEKDIAEAKDAAQRASEKIGENVRVVVRKDRRGDKFMVYSDDGYEAEVSERMWLIAGGDVLVGSTRWVKTK